MGGLASSAAPAKWKKGAANTLLKLVGMESFAGRQISQLSGGQQQRAFLARALMQQADLYLMDEPFAGIDMATEKLMIGIMKQLIREGKTILVVHHDLSTFQSTFDWIVLMNMRLIAQGETQSIFTKDNIRRTFGSNCMLFEDGLKPSEKELIGTS